MDQFPARIRRQVHRRPARMFIGVLGVVAPSLPPRAPHAARYTDSLDQVLADIVPPNTDAGVAIALVVGARSMGQYWSQLQVGIAAADGEAPAIDRRILSDSAFR